MRCPSSPSGRGPSKNWALETRIGVSMPRRGEAESHAGRSAIAAAKAKKRTRLIAAPEDEESACCCSNREELRLRLSRNDPESRRIGEEAVRAQGAEIPRSKNRCGCFDRRCESCLRETRRDRYEDRRSHSGIRRWPTV